MVTDREMTSTTQAQFLPTIWANDTRDAIEHKMVVGKLVNTKYEEEMSIGRVLRIPTRSNLETQTKSEGVGNTINFQAVTEVSQDVTVSTYEYAAQLLNAVVAAQSEYDERQRIAHAMGYSLARGMEITLTNLYQNFSQIVGTLGADPTDAEVRRAWQYLADASVDSDSAWTFGPAAVAALFGNDKFTSSDFVGGRPVIETAQLGNILGFPVYISNLLRNPASGQTECGLFHREAVIFIRQVKPTVREQFLIRNLADGLVAYDLYAAAEATWLDETPAGDSPATTGDYGAVLIRTG